MICNKQQVLCKNFNPCPLGSVVSLELQFGMGPYLETLGTRVQAHGPLVSFQIMDPGDGVKIWNQIVHL